MTLRSKEHFKVKHAKTVRMEKSGIINMTHQLNNHMKKKEKMLNKQSAHNRLFIPVNYSCLQCNSTCKLTPSL